MPEKILIVDDEKDFLDIMAERIRLRGMDVSTTTSSENALKMVDEESCDVVIMDFMMPGMDGFKTLKALKESKPEVQVILLSANIPEDKCAEALKLGALDVIEKPVNLNLLIQKIKNTKKEKILYSKITFSDSSGKLGV